jgi:type I restriction enzyme S subunit
MILSGFLHAALNSLNTKRQFNSALKGIGVPNLHLVDIRNTTIPFPNMEEQQKFIEITDKINKMREITSRSFENKMNLISSLQNQAF